MPNFKGQVLTNIISSLLSQHIVILEILNFGTIMLVPNEDFVNADQT